MQVGIPRVLSFFYYYPFYKAFLERLGCETILSAPTNARTLERLSVCPTDELCISVKLAFPHAAELVERRVERLFVPTLISRDRHSFYCPKHIGLPAMLRCGLGLPREYLLSPRVDWRAAPRASLQSFIRIGRTLGAGEGETRTALAEAWRRQSIFTREAAIRRLTIPEALEQLAGVKRLRRRRPYNAAARRNPFLRVGVTGHGYVLYDYIGHNLVDRLNEHATVLVPEMVAPREAARCLEETAYGRELWSFEQVIVGSALYWLKHGLVDCLILFGPFECGPEAVIEVFLEEEAERYGIPLLVLTVDEQTAPAGLVTRLEAFLDTAAAVTGAARRKGTEDLGGARRDGRKFVVPPLPERRVLGFPTLGKLGGALATIFNGELARAVGPLPVTRRTIELGAELAPEFICYPLTVTIGQMRQCLEAGANTLVMVGGKGRCRLGWYAEMQEMLLKRAGYDFEMLVVNSPLPLRSNYRPFVRVVRELFDLGLQRRVFYSTLLAFCKAALTEKAEDILYRLRARESSRGTADQAYRRFLEESASAASFASLRQKFSEFKRCCAAVRLENEPPLKVRLIGEIYAVFEDSVNHDIARTLGSLPDVRIEVEREITVMNWFRHNILRSPGMLYRHRRIAAAARPYLDDMVGGHGRDSVGLAALAPREGVDGIVHLWPFTCMPEIVAQNILAGAAGELDLPLLTVIVNEQSGEGGLQTRIESFAHILRERREEKGRGFHGNVFPGPGCGQPHEQSRDYQ